MDVKPEGKTDRITLQTFELYNYKKMLGTKWVGKVTNEWLLEVIKRTGVLDELPRTVDLGDEGYSKAKTAGNGRLDYYQQIIKECIR